MPILFGNVIAIGDAELRLRLDTGEELDAPIADVMLSGASDLTVGTRLRVKLQDSKIQSIVVLTRQHPEKALSAIPPEPHEEKRSLEKSVPPAVTVWGSGTISQIGKYHVTVDGADGQSYGFMRALTRRIALQEGDRVAFQAIEESHEIVDVTVLERTPAGFGGWNPCGDLLGALRSRTGREAIAELARCFCRNKRLEWYWIVPGQDAQQKATQSPLHPTVIKAVQQAEPNFHTFFKHQAKALDALNRGQHVLVLTPTASGKTYCYNPAVFDLLHKDPTARALYVFPLNALLEDQVGKLRAMAKAFEKQDMHIGVEILIGGLGREHRNQVAEHPPHILATNPEMLSWVLDGNAYHGWPDFLRRLRFVVLDEVHTYRSLLGLHMAGLIRRLLIACRRYGNPNPQFILSSATVGAPEELATRLTSLPLDDFEIIGENDDGSEQQQRHWMVLSPMADISADPHNMHLHQAALALVDVLTVPQDDLNVILFAKSIRDVQFIHRVARQLLADRGRVDIQVEKFASILLSNEEKRTIYEGLRDGKLRAVVSTNALEAGIDIGKLDVCIIAGFPFHVMRLRQMAGRAGRRREGAVIFIPHPMHVVDKFYAENPERLLTQPPETFIIDHENPYIARKHVVACAATMPGGVHHRELEAYGRNLDRIIDEARTHNVLGSIRPLNYTARPRRDQRDPWAIGNMRSAEQDPYVICNAAPDQRTQCQIKGCMAFSQKENKSQSHCPHLVQMIDRQYVYREAHPGAIFEDHEGAFFEIEDFDDRQKLVWAKELPKNTRQRTFADETTDVNILTERGQRTLAGGAKLVWGDVLVTRIYAGYYRYELIPRRRCRECRADYPITTATCPTCNRRTHPYLSTSRPQYHDFPGQYREVTYSITLETVACWLVLPPVLEIELEAISPCKIPGRRNRVAKFLQTSPPFKSPSDLTSVVGLSPLEAEQIFTYFSQSRHVFSKPHHFEGAIPIYPAFYGQCLRYHLRQHISESHALATFGKVTSYPVLTDERHVCRNCVSSVLVPAAHTLEHLVSLRYPTVALGDTQDLGSTTSVLHPQTQNTTVFWYDNYDGGIGAAEKIFDKHEVLLDHALHSLECACRSEKGCPLCTQTLRCDRRNTTLSKTAAKGLIHVLLNLPRYVPAGPAYWTKDEAQKREQEAETRERAPTPVRYPAEPESAPDEPFRLLRVQHHVHDTVLHKALEIRGEEISVETPPVMVRDLQAAYHQVEQSPRPTEWRFPEQWTAHQILHVDPEASKRLTHVAYKTIIRNVHPDHNRGRRTWATEVSKQVNGAWERVQTLWDQDRRGMDGMGNRYARQEEYDQPNTQRDDGQAEKTQATDEKGNDPQEGDTEKEKARQLLCQALADPSADFREGQWEAIDALVRERKRLLIVQRTGWGKSVVYFLATWLLRDQGAGPTLLISPLLALMRNQIEAAARLNLRAATINSANREEWKQVIKQIQDGAVDILLISPERLANEEFRKQVLSSLPEQIGLFVIDEAHCISDWGHDFRPDYQRIVRILQALPPNVPVLGTTATANDRVVKDVLGQLGTDLMVMRGPLVRHSLRLQNIILPGQAERLAWLAIHVPRMPGSGIIYALTKRDAQRLAEWLQSQGINAHAYWGSLETRQREQLEQQLLSNEVKALVATTALGMGFDKPDLEFVVHFQRPASVVHYYQQVGRAGRAVDSAYGILLGGAEDREIADYFIRMAFPPEGHVAKVLAALQQAQGGLTQAMLESRLNLSRNQIRKVLKMLAVKSPSPVAQEGSRWYATPVPYTPDYDKVKRITQIRRAEQEQMSAYLHTKDCLMAFLRCALDDPDATPCGKCANCVGKPLVPEGYAQEKVVQAIQFLKRSDQHIKPRKQWPMGAMQKYGWRGRIPGQYRPEVGRALCIWGDAGWGALVRQGKQVDGCFDDALVQGAVELICERWRPDPFPRWVTCVPSLNHRKLVPDFARSLAQYLGLPFVPCIEKICQTSPQKHMQNSAQQARNLDGAFHVEQWSDISGPVLLVDDMVDSRWTFTVLSALLREAGSGPVFPFALALVLGS